MIRLLTEHQKMELHSKALKYLRQYTRRCLTCGELQFVKLLGKTTTQEVKKTRLELIDRHLVNAQFGEANIIVDEEETNGTWLSEYGFANY